MSPRPPIGVLLVEDDPGDAEVIQHYYKKAGPGGFAVTHSKDLADALPRLVAQSADVVLLDLNLPDSEGLDTVERVHEVAPGVPIVVLTGRDDEELAHGALRAAAQDYLVKGRFDPQSLARTTRWAIERQEARRRLQELVSELTEAHQFVQTTLDVLPSRIAILDGLGHVMAINASWKRVAQHESDPAWIGTDYLALCRAGREAGEKGAEVADAVADLLAGRADERTIEYSHPGPDGGSSYLLRATRFPGECPCRVVVAHDDITALRRAEREAMASHEQLRQSQRLEAVGRLAGGIAHDFNNLLTAMAAHLAPLMESIEPDTAAEEHALGIQQAADRAAALTRQLLAFARRQEMRHEPLDLNEVVRGVHAMLARVIGPRVELVLELADELGPVRADRAQLEQVILNLVLNARDAVSGGGRITVRTDQREDEAAGRLLLAVTDTGPGMPEMVRSRVFEPFFTTKGRGRGSGLGLSVAHGIVTQFGGEIRVDSVPGRGTTFTVELPRAEADTAVRPSPAGPPRVAAEGATVLLVEDEAMLRPLLRQRLEASGFRVLEASGVDEAALRAREEPGIDVLLADVLLPDGSGTDLARRLAGTRPGLRVLLMSGQVELPEGFTAEEMIQKPFAPSALARRIRELLGRPGPG